jgi:hypothetical protein
MSLAMKNHKLLRNFTALVQQQTKEVRPYNDSYISMDLTWINDSNCLIPLCLICGKRLTNAAMSPASLKQQSQITAT